MSRNHKLKNELTELIENSGLAKFKSDKEVFDFRDLMKFRIEKILMVCSLYDYYSLVEDGHLQEAIFNEFSELNLYYAPIITRTYTGESAIEEIKKENYDLVIATLRLGDMELDEFCRKAKEINKDLPLVLLASQSRELAMLKTKGLLALFDKIFIWAGDRRVFLAIIKHFEDLRNAPVDCLRFGITVIILVEDSPEYYSSYLPLIYTEVMNQSQKLIMDGKNSAEKMLRQRARPKILLAENYENAMEFVHTYKDSLLGIITDLEFQCNGKEKKDAGLLLIENVRKVLPELPVLLQTSSMEIEDIAQEYKISFVNKNSRTLLMELHKFILNNFGFGEFIFRMPNGDEVVRAKSIRDFRNKLRFIPEESLLYHSAHNHFSYWFIARTEFELSNKIKPVDISQFNNAAELREHIVALITHQLIESNRGIIAMYSRRNYDEDRLFQMIGEGSLGGKARGLAFIDKILKDYISPDYFPRVRISIPKTIILGTDVFSQFMELNNLYSIVVEDVSDDLILREFLKADLPPAVLGDLGDILNKVRYPIAVRSSSLLEDAMYQPFAGIYATMMIPNSSVKNEIRFQNLVQAIKFVYASTFSKNAKNYIEATGNRIEEEKMGIILQEMVGKKFGQYFYPHFSGVTRSYNYYPFGKAKPDDGIINLALGLGKTIVDGGMSLQYCSEYPGVYPQFASTKDLFNKSQVKFWALDLTSDYVRRKPSEEKHLTYLDFDICEKHDTLRYLASTYSAENDMLYEGISRQGPRILNFAPILKSQVIPLNDILKLVTKMSEVSLNSPVEIEFAVSLGQDAPKPAYFGFLQVRPMVKPEGNVEIDIDNIPREQMLVLSDMTLGNGSYEINYILYVKPDVFDASITRQIASEISTINKKMTADNNYYLLIGPGRWGSSDPWLGIPVDFSSIARAQVIIETQLPNMIVDPSQGAHFFQNMTSFKIAYMTIKSYGENNFIDWDWLSVQEIVTETKYVRLIKVIKPVVIKVEGKTGIGIALKGD